jgi:hypothetical protein
MNAGFSYALPLQSDGLYTLVLKFSEVYFQEPGQKVFDVKLGRHTVIPDLDIFGILLSRGIPYDEFIEFTLQNGKVFVEGQEAVGAYKNGKVQVEFAVGRADNPKVNAILLVEGGRGNTHYQNHKRYMNVL